MGDWLEGGKGPAVRCPVCGYLSRSLMSSEEGELFVCAGIRKHVFKVLRD